MAYNLIERLKRAKSSGEKIFAVLIDPDHGGTNSIPEKVRKAEAAGADLFLVGGSLVAGLEIDRCIEELKKQTNKPVYLFPGSPVQFSDKADGILFLSLVSGRNPELLIGRHVEIAPTLKASKMEVIPTAYLLVNGGKATSASYMSNTQPIPSEKSDIVRATAQAGELLGMQLAYLDAGSGAHHPIPAQTIKAVADGIDIPLIVGGGLNTESKRREAFEAGANMVVSGTAFE